MLGGLACLGTTSPIYQNFGVVTSPPQVDATVFVNGGTFDLSATSGGVFDTQNTLYYTNLASGFMNAPGGFNFQFITNGFPLPASSFRNQGEVDGFLLRIAATNVANSGILLGSGNGLVKIDANSVDLTRGGVDALALGSSTPAQLVYAGVGTNNTLSGNGRAMPLTTFNLPSPASPNFEVIMPGNAGTYFTNRVSVPVLSTKGFGAFASTNQVDPTNLIVEVIFVSTNSFDTNMAIRAGFMPYAGGDVPGNIAVVEWKYPDYDIIRGNPFTNYFYLVDTTMTQTNYSYFTNQTTSQIISPDVFTLSQGTNQSFTLGLNSPFGFPTTVKVSKLNSVTFTNTLISNPKYAATTVTNFYAGYSGLVGSFSSASSFASSTGSLVSDLNPALFDPTNQPGRVEINADRIDLSRTRLRAASLLSINATNLLSATNVIFDSPLLKFDLGWTNGTLDVSNNIPFKVKRLNGQISAWTALWTNSMDITNVDSSGNPATNTENIITHVLIVDHNFLGQQTVETYGLTLHTRSLILNDDLTLTKSLLIDADNLDISANIDASIMLALGPTNWPHLINFTNEGSVTISGGNFDGRLPSPLSTFYNRSNMSANAFTFASSNFINSGAIKAQAGSITVSTIDGKLDDGQLLAADDVRITADQLKVRNSKLAATTLYVTATNLLSDGLAATNNKGSWLCTAGFQVLAKPPTGDLLNTTLISSNSIFAQTLHIWSGQDHGPNVSGYTNNLAVGKLMLVGAPFSQFAFTGTGSSNALYVDYLDLEKNATNYLDALQIDTNMVIYFAAANLDPTKLDGQFNGRLRWVSDFAGPYSTTNVTLANGQVIRVNVSLLQSTTIDSDADGIPNATDKSPFDGVRLSSLIVTNGPPLTTLLSWKAAADTVYRVEYATNLATTSWQLLGNITNTATTNQVITFKDTPPTSTDRYYRVGYTP